MPSYLNTKEKLLCDQFLDRGIIRHSVELRNPLHRIRETVTALAQEALHLKAMTSLDWMHKYLPPEKLNETRLHIIKGLNAEPWFHEAYYSLGCHALNTLVGNELVMQRRINLSIQLPNDASSLLPVHCDTWSGDSPYEVVLWVPLVDCYGTKSMYFCDAKKDAEIQPLIAKYEDSEELFKAIEPHVTFMDVKYGECLIFTQNIMHGNRVNTTNETRWSMNCRFKSALSPYADKKLGEFFEPITLRPATKLGMRYEYPRV